MVKAQLTFTASIEIAKYLDNRKKNERDFIKSKYLCDLILEDMKKRGVDIDRLR